MYHKYAYKQKKKDGDPIKEDEIKQSDVKMNNLVSDPRQTETARRR